MKNTVLFFFLLIFASISFKASSQVQTDKFDPKEKVYWFYLNAGIKLDLEMNRDVYVVGVSSKKPKYGNFASYEKEVWKCLQGGHQIVIGPFREFNAARQSIEIYNLTKIRVDLRGKEIKKLIDSSKISDEEYYCYYIKFYVTERTKVIKLQRIPARTSIDGISLSDFLDQFLEGLTMEMLAIGPFATRPEAEESKRLNRLEEK